MGDNITVPFYGAAFLAVDCQTVFARAACQGNADTEQAVKNLERELPLFRKKGRPLYTLFTKTKSVKDAGLLACVEDGITVSKKHESAFTGSDLHQQLRRSMVSSVFIGGFHLATCVAATAMGGVQRGYRTYVVTDLCGEGDRGRNLSADALEERKEAACEQMKKAGVVLVRSRDLIL